MKKIIADKENILEKSIQDIKNAFLEYDSLFDFYTEISALIKREKIKLEKEYKYGLIIAHALDSIYEVSLEKRNAKIDEIYKVEIKPGTTIKDVIPLIEYKTDNKTGSLSMSFSKYRLDSFELNPVIAKNKEKCIEQQIKIFNRTILSNIVITFENYLSNLLHTLILCFPEKYFEGKTVKTSDLLSKDVLDIVNENVEYEVEKLMYDSILALDVIKDKDKIIIDRYDNMQKEFEEIYYRRNLFVHNDGIINKIYLKNVDNIFTNDKYENQELICDDVYLSNALDCCGQAFL